MNEGFRWNFDDLVEMAVTGQVSQPAVRRGGYVHWPDGVGEVLPGMYGITYNARVGDRAFGWAADCIHPGVSIGQVEDNWNRGLNVFACVGNTARVMSGEAAGTVGVVTGKSGRFSEQVIVHIPQEARSRMTVGDQVLVRAEGVGLSLTDHPDVSLKGISGGLLAALPAEESNGQVAFGVTAQIPAHLVGAGLGLTSEGGSLHMQSTDRKLLQELSLDRLHLGDLVALEDTDSRYNHGYLRGARAIGVVASTDGPRAGYGPGIAILMTAPAEQLGSFESTDTNLVQLLDIED